MARLFSLLLVLAAALSGQSKVALEQMKGKTAPAGTQVQLFAVKADGSISQLKLGSGLLITVDAATGQLVLSLDGSIVAPPASTRVYSEGPTPNGSNLDVWTLANTPLSGTEEVYVNGIRQKPAGDYDIAGKVITFRKLCADQAGQPMSCLGSTPLILVSYSR